ncbi:MAG: LexA family protein, partial [Butyricicoccus porcorum]
GEHFGLRVRGQSMEPRILEGDVIIVRKQEDVDSGDTAIVLVNGYEATVKKIKKTDEGIALIPNNPAFDTIFYSNREIVELPVQILGKVVELRGKNRF